MPRRLSRALLATALLATSSAVAARADAPRSEVLELARRAFACARSQGLFDAPLLTVIDYSLPSSQRRLWLLDVETGETLLHDYVAHGQGSGADRATRFSNAPGSHQSSLGLFRTAESYYGRHGRSLRLNGLEPGVNDRARERAIVIHGADYVSEAFVGRHGRLGRSWGCPAVRPEVNGRLIDRIGGGTALFAYYPDPAWLDSSRFLRCQPDA